MTLLQRQTRELEHDNVAGCEKLFGTVSVRECCVLSGTERESSESREARVPEREEIFHETGDGEHRSICGPSPASTCVHRLALLSSRVLARRELVRLCHRIRVSRHVEPRLLNLDSSHFSYLVMSYVNPPPPPLLSDALASPSSTWFRTPHHCDSTKAIEKIYTQFRQNTTINLRFLALRCYTCLDNMISRKERRYRGWNVGIYTVEPRLSGKWWLSERWFILYEFLQPEPWFCLYELPSFEPCWIISMLEMSIPALLRFYAVCILHLYIIHIIPGINAEAFTFE